MKIIKVCINLINEYFFYQQFSLDNCSTFEYANQTHTPKTVQNQFTSFLNKIYEKHILSPDETQQS